MNREIECSVSSKRNLMKNHGHPRVMALYAELHILRYGLITAKEEPRILSGC
jgi:hypothetical protein